MSPDLSSRAILKNSHHNHRVELETYKDSMVINLRKTNQTVVIQSKILLELSKFISLVSLVILNFRSE